MDLRNKANGLSKSGKARDFSELALWLRRAAIPERWRNLSILVIHPTLHSLRAVAGAGGSRLAWPQGAPFEYSARW